jgi:hypothetical protein
MKNLCNIILSKGPKDRYVADLWVLPPELNSSHASYKYVIDIINHFSKYTESNLLNTKESYEIFPKIKNFIKIHDAPKYLITDNGGEFKNHMLKKFCIDNNIKFLHGLPYRPHSQGVVERVHQVIKEGLLCHKEDLKDKYNINYALDEVINIKNDTVCRATNKTPNELFFKNNLDKKEIEKINDLMLKSQKNCNVYKKR